VEEEDEDEMSAGGGNDSWANDSRDKPFNDMDDILNADTSYWDPFRDAHKFEALAAAEQHARQSAVQAQFDLIKQQEAEERD